MTILHAEFSPAGSLAWSMTTSGEPPHKAGTIPAGERDPLAELRHLELVSGIGRVEFTVTPEHPLTPSEREYATAHGWKLL